MESNLSIVLNSCLKNILFMKFSVNCTVGPWCEVLWLGDIRDDCRCGGMTLALRVLNQVFNFNLSVYPPAVLTQHKAKGRLDNDLFNLIDVDCKMGCSVCKLSGR